jgi:hypothetical protein
MFNWLFHLKPWNYTIAYDLLCYYLLELINHIKNHLSLYLKIYTFIAQSRFPDSNIDSKFNPSTSGWLPKNDLLVNFNKSGGFKCV